MAQQYKVLSGSFKLHLDNRAVILWSGDTFTVKPALFVRQKVIMNVGLISSMSGWAEERYIVVKHTV
jgi:hypothetical protein